MQKDVGVYSCNSVPVPLHIFRIKPQYQNHANKCSVRATTGILLVMMTFESRPDFQHLQFVINHQAMAIGLGDTNTATCTKTFELRFLQWPTHHPLWSDSHLAMPHKRFVVTRSQANTTHVSGH